MLTRSHLAHDHVRCHDVGTAGSVQTVLHTQADNCRGPLGFALSSSSCGLIYVTSSGGSGGLEAQARPRAVGPALLYGPHLAHPYRCNPGFAITESHHLVLILPASESSPTFHRMSRCETMSMVLIRCARLSIELDTPF